ncbi:hypothetical protein KDW_11190 [Dictyobacter vulcani]|uniref:Uncharacterized protein n=1 Tax=Dictyobacter vulcani TaxID=2607529 RepID=A0A5J4KKI6_9CHLR|nr:hypothetical protein [Dictyobacter vulcani]GER86957.1 hypothetical protein KDW_11190 [Dictyobacter vulcani]
MRKQYLRWILPILALLIMATVLVLGPAIFSHAAGVTTGTPTPASTAPASPIKPSWSIFN